MQKTSHLICLGEALIDFTPTKDGSYSPSCGGAPYNVALCASKFGVNAIFAGKLGKDAFGEMLKSVADSFAVNTSALVMEEGCITTHSFVSLDENGERDFVFCRDADIKLSKEDIDEQFLKTTEIFHFGSLSLTANPSKEATLWAMKTAKSAGTIISFDPNYRALLWGSEAEFINTCAEVMDAVDVLKVSEEEAIMISGEKNAKEALKMLAKNRLVFMTCGAKGAYYANHAAIGFVPAVKANTVDTTGAGDIFYGVALSEIIKRKISPFKADDAILNEITEKACSIASKSTEKYGAVNSIPQDV